MGNTMDRQMSLRKKASDAMSRLDVLESQMDDVQKTLPQLAMGINEAINRLGQQLQDITETLDAVVGQVGLTAVQTAIADARLARMQASAETTKANIAKAVEEGKLVKVEKVGEKSLLVGRELKADGAVIPPGYAAVSFTQVKQEYKEKLTGQAAGFSMDTDSGGKFEVQEIYESVEAPAVVPAVVEAQPTPAPEASTEAPAQAGG